MSAGIYSSLASRPKKHLSPSNQQPAVAIRPNPQLPRSYNIPIPWGRADHVDIRESARVRVYPDRAGTISARAKGPAYHSTEMLTGGLLLIRIVIEAPRKAQLRTLQARACSPSASPQPMEGLGLGTPAWHPTRSPSMRGAGEMNPHAHYRSPLVLLSG